VKRSIIAGVLNDREVRYHERKAAGGAGLIMTFGSASVYRESAASYGSVSLWDPENEPFLRVLRSGRVQTIHTREATLEDVFVRVTGRTLE
jgi:2,4-dienoyl-CoA reductase-like NADH-dependent reductase (Old Yellow Enzyme family)